MKGSRSGAVRVHFSFQNLSKMKESRRAALSLHFSSLNLIRLKGNRSGAISLHFPFQVWFKCKEDVVDVLESSFTSFFLANVIKSEMKSYWRALSLHCFLSIKYEAIMEVSSCFSFQSWFKKWKEVVLELSLFIFPFKVD